MICLLMFIIIVFLLSHLSKCFRYFVIRHRHYHGDMTIIIIVNQDDDDDDDHTYNDLHFKL